MEAASVGNGTLLEANDSRPEMWLVWLLGVASVTGVSLCAVVGVALLPLVSGQLYERSLTLLVGLGVGTLSGSAIFHLLPQAFGLVESHAYMDKAVTALTGVYAFYASDKLIKLALHCYKNRQRPTSHPHNNPDPTTPKIDQAMFTSDLHLAWTNEDGKEGGSKGEGTTNPNCICPMTTCECVRPTKPHPLPLRRPGDKTDDNGEEIVLSPAGHSSARLIDNNDEGARGQLLGEEEIEMKPVNPPASPSTPSTALMLQHDRQAHAMCQHDHDVRWKPGESAIGAVAWMIVFGDGLHNFIDGVSMGAAYSRSILSGVSVTVAVACEEFPHELGDVAILLAAGMSLTQALTYNVLSALTCYLGLAVGILVGELADLSAYVFALAAGMFLYISLATMIPELNAAMERRLNEGGPIKALGIFCLQSIGLLLGLSIMYFMTVYGAQIDFE